MQKLFKEITSFMQNVDEVHVTGTGTAQEQFIRFMSETPQFKNAVAKESTSNKMSDEKLLEFMSEKFN
jgi:stalled ribosome rescue protein Dom34